MALGEADTAVEQEVLVPNTPIRGMIQLEKRGAVLKSFIESQDPFGYTIHTPIYEDGSLAGAVYEVRAAEDVIGKEGTVWFKANELVTTITTTSEEISESELLPWGITLSPRYPHLPDMFWMKPTTMSFCPLLTTARLLSKSV